MIDIIIWEMQNLKPVFIESIGWEFAKYLTNFVQNCYEIETGKIPFVTDTL